MSMGSWYILITKLYESLKLSGEAQERATNLLQVEVAAARAPSR